MKKFIVEQKLAPITNQYRIFDADRQLLAFAQQKRFTMKEKVDFYTNETKLDLAFSVVAEKTLDVHGHFFVKDSKGKQLGSFRKVFKQSLLRSTYELKDHKQQIVARLHERSTFIAVLRRVWGLVPFIGELPFIFRYHFDFVESESDKIIAKYNKTTRFRDHYELIIENEELVDKIGWQTLVAQAVMLDVMQGR